MSKAPSFASFGAITALGLAIGLAGQGSAMAQTYQTRVKAGERIRLDAYASDDGYQSGCASRPGTVRLLLMPRGGRVTQGLERAVLNNKLKATGDNDCLRAPKNASAVYYAARPDFSGVDKVVTGVTFDNGDYHQFTYVVTVDPGDERPAPAATPAARPREAYRPAAAPAYVPPPSARPAEAAAAAPTSASDFLARAAREGRRSAPPSVTPGLPSSAAAQEPTVPSAERLATAQPKAASAPASVPAEMAPPPQLQQQRVYEPRL